MKTKVELIKSCNQDWNNMMIVDRHKFCLECKKNVIDFTNTDKFEILRQLDKNEEVCARIKLSQLDQLNSLNLKPTTVFHKSILAIGFGAILGTSQPIIAQTKVENKEIRAIINDTLKAPIPQSKKVITATVFEEGSNLPLPGINVQLIGTTMDTMTDINGEFKLEIAQENFNPDSLIRLQYIGLKTVEIPIKDMIQSKAINMVIDPECYNEVIVVGGLRSYRVGFFRRIGEFFNRLFRSKNNR